MRIDVLKILLKKELLDVFRDKKAVLMMILVPVLMYPLIFMGTLMVMTMIETSAEESVYSIATIGNDDEFIAAVDSYNEDHMVESEDSDATDGTISSTNTTEQIKLYDGGKLLSEAGYDIENVSADISDAADSVSGGDTDGAVVDGTAAADDTESTVITFEDAINTVLQDETVDAIVVCNGNDSYDIYYVSSITDSSYAEEIIEEIMADMSDNVTYKLISDAGLDADAVMNPIEVSYKDEATSEQSAGNMLGTILPFMLVVSLLMGTMYPAIDTTAGEKERGTMETLFMLPVTNREVIVAKFLTVAMMGIISTFLNIISIVIMVIYMVKLLAGSTSGSFDMSNFNVASFVPAMIVTVLAVLAFSLFISAISMCVCALAKSYKEANNYITPLTLVVMFTGYIGFLPNVELTETMALIPVANICLLIKELLNFNVSLKIIAIVLLSNVIYAAAATMLLSRIYDSEGILFDEGRSGIQLFERRSNMKKGGVPTTGDAWFVILFTMIVYLYLGSVLELKYGTWGVFGIQMIILLIPLLFAIYTKRDLKRTYSVKAPRPYAMLAALVLMIGTIVLGIVLTSIVSAIFPQSAETVSTELYSMLLGDNIWETIFIVALAPAICEEMMFRGFVLSAFKSKYKAATSILLVAVIFGVYHMSIVRFFTTALLGASLAYMVHRTGSIFISMTMHFMNNLIAVLEMYYPDVVMDAFPLLSGSMDSVLGLIVITALGITLMVAGVYMFETLNRKNLSVQAEEN